MSTRSTLIPIIASALLLALSSQAGAQTAEQLQSKLASLSGAKEIKISDLADADVGQTFKVANGKYHVDVFPTQKDGAYHNFVLAAANLAVGQIAPLRSTDPMGGLRFGELMLVLAEVDNTQTIAKLPRAVRDALNAAAPHSQTNSLTLRKGLNAIALIEAGQGPLGRFLGGTLGLRSEPIPVVGALPMAAIARLLSTRNVSISKADWLKGLSLSGPIGGLKPKGFPATLMQWPSHGSIELSGTDGAPVRRI